MLNSSMAGTSRQYVIAQGTLAGYENCLHLQIAGVGGNRGYGFSWTSAEQLPKKLVKYFNGLEAAVPSKAGTGKGYFVVQLAVREPNTVHVQVGGPVGNRQYGLTFDIESAGLAAFVSGQVTREQEAIKAAAEAAALVIKPTDSFIVR